MSRDQVAAQETQQSDAASDAKTADETHGVPPQLYREVMSIKQGPGGAEALAAVMAAFNGRYARQIAAVAATNAHLGNALVQEAIRLVEARGSARVTTPYHSPAPGSANAFDKQEFRRDTANDQGDVDDNLRGLDGNASDRAIEPLPPELRARVMALRPGDAAPLAQLLSQCPVGMREEVLMLARSHLGVSTVAEAVQIKQSSPADGTQPAAESSAGKPAHATTALEAAARAYNAAHAHLVEEFNELTDDKCRPDGNSELDLHAVVQWQTHHGLVPDGKVGPHTVATARKLKAQSTEAVAAPKAEARPPV